MATANPLRDDNYELELSQVRENIRNKFVELIDYLKARESELFRELDNILASYLSYRSQLDRENDKKRDLVNMQNALKGVVSTSPVKGMKENILAQISTELKTIETPIEPKMVTFVCNSNKMLAELNKLGKLVEKFRPEIDYKSKNRYIPVHSQMSHPVPTNYSVNLNRDPYGQSIQSQYQSGMSYQPNVDRQIGNQQSDRPQTTKRCPFCSSPNRMQDVYCVKCGNSMVQAT